MSARRVRGLLQTVFGLALLGLWSRSVPLGAAWSDARPRHWAPLAGLVALTLVGALLRAVRWARISRPVARLGTTETFWMNSAGGLLNYVLPIRSGDVARVWWVTRRHRLAAGAALGTILVDKAWDLGAVVVALGGTATVLALSGRASTTLVAGAGAAAGVAGLLLPGLAATAWLSPHLVRFRRLAGQAEAFAAAVRPVKSSPLLAGLSMAALTADALGFTLLFRALDLPVPLPAAAAAYAALALAYAIPSAPGYLGSLELAGTLVIGAGLGVPAVAAAGATLLWHAVNALIMLALGVLGLAMLGRPRLERASGRPRRLAVLHCGFTYSGGGERIVIEEVLGLRRRGYRVDCFAPIVDPQTCYPDLLPQVAPRTFLPQLPRWFPLRGAVQMAAASALVPLYAWRFRGCDAILGANQPSAWIAWCLHQLTGCPYAVYLNQPNRLIHPRAVDLATGWQNRPDYHVLNAVIQRMRAFVRWADQRSVDGAGELLVDGRYIGDRIRAIYRRDAIDCPAGCHVEPGFPLPVDDRFGGETEVNGTRLRRPYVLLTNRHEPQKRFDLAIRAMALVAERRPEVRLVVPGPATSHTPELVRLVSTLALERNVTFCGPVSEERLQRLYAEAAIYVYPAPEEDFGMGVIEAMARGVPVVAWNQAGPTVTVSSGRTGHLARPGDVADYASGILAYLDDPDLNQRAGRAAHARARQFDWSRHMDTVERALLAVCGASETGAVSEIDALGAEAAGE